MKSIISILSITVILLISYSIKAQNVTITPSGITPALSGTYPRLSYDDITALSSPTVGDIAYDLTYLCLRVYNGTEWACTYQNPSDPTPNIAAIAAIKGGNINNVESVGGIALDATGNVYVVGTFEQTADFGGGPVSAFPHFDNLYIAKFNSSGNLQWVQTEENPDISAGIVVDAAGNVFITGSYTGTTSFGATSISSAGSSDIYVAKFNSSGNLQWVQSGGGTGDDRSQDIALDANGDVFITGYFEGTANFGAASRTSAGDTDIFVVKYSGSSGNVQWLQSAGGTSSDVARGIAIDATGNVLITGHFSGTANFGATSRTLAGGRDVFVAEYSPLSTSWLWTYASGGPNDDIGKGIALNASGNAYITGEFSGTANLGGSTLTSAGSRDIFIAFYDTSVGLPFWARSAGGESFFDYVEGISLDGNENILITGYFRGTANFGAKAVTSVGDSDIFVAKFKPSNLTWHWAQSAGGRQDDKGLGIANDANGNIFVPGTFGLVSYFGSNSLTSLFRDIFIMRIQE